MRFQWWGPGMGPIPASRAARHCAPRQRKQRAFICHPEQSEEPALSNAEGTYARRARRVRLPFRGESMSLRRLVLISVFTTVFSTLVAAESSIVVLQEGSFPTSDSAAAPAAFLHLAFTDAQFTGVSDLKDRLRSSQLLVLPYGSAFPEEVWPEIQGYLQRGGNLLVLGGRPFTRAAYRDQGSWKLRDYSVRYTRPLMIDQYQETPGSQDLKFESNSDIPLALPQFAWKQSFSPIIHLSAVDLYQRGGSAGSIDANLDALAWGTKDGRRMSAPVIQIDHLRNGFDGGRWIFVDAELAPDFYSSAAAGELISKIAEQAMRGAEEFTVRPVMPLYLRGEPIELQVKWNSAQKNDATVSIIMAGENQVLDYETAPMR